MPAKVHARIFTQDEEGKSTGKSLTVLDGTVNQVITLIKENFEVVERKKASKKK